MSLSRLYYKMDGSEKLTKFLEDAEKYVAPLAPHTLPPAELLPRRRTAADAKQMFPKPIELRGYCPVTFLEGKCRFEAIVPGNPELVAEYLNKLYYLETVEKLQKFMRKPDQYSNLKLPHKLPPKREPMVVSSLPMLGYLEQTVAVAITKAVTAVGTVKPKYPFLNASKSALIYVAFHLKANNPNSPVYLRKKYKKQLEHLEEACELIKYLGNNMTKRYQEPQDRPFDFDYKLDRFVQLRSNPPLASMTQFA